MTSCTLCSWSERAREWGFILQVSIIALLAAVCFLLALLVEGVPARVLLILSSLAILAACIAPLLPKYLR